MEKRSRKRRRAQEDFAAEIQSHIDLEADRLVSDGMHPEEARFAAMRSFGSVLGAQERFYEAGRVLWLDRLAQDVRFGWRSLCKSPFASLVAVLSLAAGIGATTATLIVRDTIFLRPPPLYRDPAQLSRVNLGWPERPRGPVPTSIYRMWAEDSALQNSIAAASGSRRIDVRTETGMQAILVRNVTAGFFSLLGVDSVMGRTLSASAAEDGQRPAVLSYRVWQEFFAQRPDVLGQTIWIADQPHIVIGIMPERFWFSEMDAPIWTSLDVRTPREEGLDVVIRRPHGMTRAQLEDRIQADLRVYANRLPASRRQVRAEVRGIGGTPPAEQMAPVLPWLFGTSVLLTLLIACANVAILVIVRWTAREHEIAIRTSLGANRARIVRLLLTESVLIALSGGVLGICATLALRAYFVHGAGPEVLLYDLSIDPLVLMESMIVAAASGIIAGLGPALLETRRMHVNPMRLMSLPDSARQRWRHALVIMEIAVTMALSVVTATMIDGYRRNLSMDYGFPTHPLLTLRLENQSGVAAAQIVERLRRVPGVAAAAASTAVPLTGRGESRTVAADASGSIGVTAEQVEIGTGFFDALGVSMLAGREFATQDFPANRAVIVNEKLVRRLFAGRNPIGAYVWIDRASYAVAGVVADYSSAMMHPPQPTIFVPLDAATPRQHMQFVVRAVFDPAPLVAAIRAEMRERSGGNVVTNLFPIDSLIELAGQEILIGTLPMTPLLLIGMLLSAAGIYGVLAFAVERRSREMAVRIALGASMRDMVGLVVQSSLRLVVAGVILGVSSTFALSRFAQGSGGVFDSPHWGAFVFPVVIIAAIAALATWVPSRRAQKIDTIPHFSPIE